MGHEYVGFVEEVGEDVRTVRPGQFVVGSFMASDNSCPIFRPATARTPRPGVWPGSTY
jgi:Zn-dependent alcohol dehydrogenase